MSTGYEKISVKYLIQIEEEDYQKVKAIIKIDPMHGDVIVSDVLRTDIDFMLGVKNVSWDIVPGFMNIEINSENHEDKIKEVMSTIEKHIKESNK